MKPKARRALALQIMLSAIVFVVFMAIWSLLASQFVPLVLPGPVLVFKQLVEGTLDGTFGPNFAITLIEVLLGFLGGSLLGIGFGILLGHSELLRKALNPYVITSQALPKLALAPILVAWFGFGLAPKVLIAALIAFFPLMENTMVGLQSTPRDALQLLHSLSASRTQIFLKLRLPHALPLIFAGLRVAMVLSVVGAIVGEYVGANAGLGALIIVAQGTMNTAQMFAAFILLTVMGVVLYLVIDWIEKLFLTRYQEPR
jgi:NitT/TauT family transport system permease protein